MNWNVINLLLVLSTASALPQNIKIPEVTDYSSPEEVNALQNTPKVQRSISDHVPGENSEVTIREVEGLIKNNPNLPRLTRGEILDILDNITRQDQQNLINVISKDVERDPKALMVVKAYTPLGSGEVNVEEFYTKPPVTTIIENDSEEQLNIDQLVSPSSTSAPYFRRKPTKSTEEKKITNVERKKPYRGNSNFKTTTTLSSTPRTRSTTTTERLTTSFLTTTTKLPSTTRKEIKRRRRPPVTTTTTSTSTMMAITTYRPRGRLPPRKEIIYSNHKYPEDVSTTRPPVYSSSGIRVVEPPKFEAHQINYDLEDLVPEEGEHQEMFVPMTGDQGKKDYTDDKVNSISEPSIELEIPDHLKKVVADLNLAAMKDPDSVSVTSIIAPSEKAESEKIKDILASLGVLPPSTTPTEMPDAKLVAESLSPDMQDLLKSFGLLPNPSKNDDEEKNSVAGFNPEKAEIHPESYVGFKPLPEDSKGRKEMEELLEQFGLLDKHNRRGKSIKKGEAPSKNEDLQIEQINLDAIPEDFQPLLNEMGFGERSGRKIREKAHPNKINEKISESKVESTENTLKTIEKQHVFNPTESEYVTEEEIQKLGRLLEIMKKLEELNGTITEDDMQHIDQKELKDLLNSLKPPPGQTILTLNDQNAPNPVEYDFGLNKNEVKRQEVTTTEKVETVTADEYATEETKTPSIKDLEDSFGGSTSAVTEALPETTTPRRNGFYYLLDWNTFFEIDDQKGKRVNLRFQPKVGDPKRFLSVTVP